MAYRKWWNEAAAEYAACRIAVPAYQRMSIQNTVMPANYLTTKLIQTGPAGDPFENHEYHGAYFLDYVVRHILKLDGTPITTMEEAEEFAAMWRAVVSESIISEMGDVLIPMDAFLRGRSPKLDLDHFFTRFAHFYLVEGNTVNPRGDS
jgi:hypothetical protein